MIKIARGLQAALLGLFAVPALFGTARSDTYMSRAGHAFYLSDASCFGPKDWNGTANNCATTKVLESPLVNRFSAGVRNFTASSPSGGGLGTHPVCTAVIVSSGGAYVWAGSAMSTSNSGNPKNIGSHWAADTDSLNINCSIPPTIAPDQPLNTVGVF